MKRYVTPPVTKPVLPGLSDFLKSSVESFSAISGIPVTFFSKAGDIQWECRPECKFCRFFDIYTAPESLCRRNLMSASNFVSQLGEPYIFTCRLGLVKIAVALIVDGSYMGCFMAGPLIMGSLRESTIATLLSINENLPGETIPKVVIFMRSMRVFQPKEVAHLAVLLNNCVMASLASSEDYSRLKEHYKEQSRIGRDLQAYKKQNKSMNYPYALENELLQRVRSGDTDGARKLFQELLGQIVLLEAGELTAVKNKVLGVYAILSRTVPEQNAAFQSYINLDFEALYSLDDVHTLDELFVRSASFIGQLSEKVFASIYNGSSEIITNAVQYISRNYMRKISLHNIAAELHINQSYLSMLFKQEMGVTFTEYLNSVRINKARHLLERTNLTMIDISLQSGFEDQSYFTKVFKKLAGVTPKQYRRLHGGDLEREP